MRRFVPLVLAAVLTAGTAGPAAAAGPATTVSGGHAQPWGLALLPDGSALFTERGSEQTFYFDFYIYDAEDSVIRLLLVVPFESREVWDRVGRFKRQYPMYTYELWTPERLAQLGRPRAQLGF